MDSRTVSLEAVRVIDGALRDAIGVKKRAVGVVSGVGKTQKGPEARRMRPGAVFGELRSRQPSTVTLWNSTQRSPEPSSGLIITSRRP